jgi:hypothetical protein
MAKNEQRKKISLMLIHRTKLYIRNEDNDWTGIAQLTGQTSYGDAWLAPQRYGVKLREVCVEFVLCELTLG